MKKDPNRLDIMLSMYPKTTEIFSEFRKAKNVRTDPFSIEYLYDTMLLKDFMNISFRVNGKIGNYSIGFIVKHCDYWNKEQCEKRKHIKYGVLMSEFKKDYYKRVFYNDGNNEGILQEIFTTVSNYVVEGNRVNESIINFSGFELYAQDTYSRNNPSYYVEYGETHVYIVDEMVVDKVGLVWED